MNQHLDPETPPNYQRGEPSAHSTELQAAFARLPRRAVLAGAAITAVGAGVAISWVRNKPSQTPSVTEAVPDFWSLNWSTPSGASLSTQSLKGRPLLVNFWATWCPPCVEELPLINAFFLQNQANGWQVLGLAVDKPAIVQAFLVRTPLNFPVAMAGFDGTELSKRLGNLTGGLPFSVALNSQGEVIQRKMGRLDSNDLALLGGLK